uniref:Uncharacterized protein n=1 Tax=Cucumis melo TaxID=3656 RepID=A0A9I9DD12_CUCME
MEIGMSDDKRQQRYDGRGMATRGEQPTHHENEILPILDTISDLSRIARNITDKSLMASENSKSIPDAMHGTSES